MTGAVSYQSGLAAEYAVAADYRRRGFSEAARRWRGEGGEIDLVFRDGAGLVFVEVKKARDFARAAERLTVRQLQRIWNAASEFLGAEPGGLMTQVRVDLALVDGVGRIRVIENVMLD